MPLVSPVEQPLAAVFAVDDAGLARHRDLFGPNAAARCLALAHALASSPPWRRLSGSAWMVARPRAGLIGVLGSINDDERPHVDALGWHVPDLIERLRPVAWSEVQAAVVDLADQLRDRLTAQELNHCRLVPVPRGGLVVAGLVAQRLGISRDRVGDDGAARAVVILIDDCALSGNRIREWVRRFGDREVIVATLHSHPDLRRSVVAREHLRAFVSSRDLVDHAVARPNHEDWLRRWAERSPSDYWTGDPDHLCYPWNEPDVAVWNDRRHRAEPGWHVVPPTWCLKNTPPPAPHGVQLCVEPRGSLAPVPNAVWADADEAVLVAVRGQPRALVLHGGAAMIWRAVLAAGNRGGAAELIAGRATVDGHGLREDIDRVVGSLLEQGILADAAA